VIEPTRGEILVDGSVQALMQVGVGFHPEMSGIENVKGALIYNGMTGDELRQAIDEIVEFAELGDYLERPLRTYSLGMKARLQFAAATAIRPSILVIDEILGAGDAYFAVKSAERMRKLMGGGCTLLLVSHSMPQVHQFCERVVWIERGRVIADGDPISVINAYEEFIARYQTAAEHHSAAGGKGGVPEWLREKLARESLSTLESTGGDPAQVRGSRAGARWAGPGPLRISQIQLLGPDEEPTDRLGMTGPFGIAVTISTELPGTYPCTTIVFIYHEHGYTITRAALVDDALILAENGVARRIAWFDRNFLGNGRYMVSAGLYRRFDVGAPQAAERYDILSKAAHFEVAALPNDPSLVRIAPTWLSA
jgi:lipopolysaccharide transport system ATP-binding protein